MANPFARPVGNIAGAVAQSGIEARMGFIRKVYATFFASLVVAFAGVMAVVSVPAVSDFVRAFLFPLFIVEIGLVIGALVARKKAGWNVGLLGAFTLVSGLVTGAVVQAYIAAGAGPIVAQAGGLTVVAFGGLTGYVFVSKKDFSFLRGFVTIGLFVIIGGSILNFFIAAPAFSFAISAGGVLLFSAFILYDTSNILHHHREDEWVAAALSLYLDFLNMFLFLLRLLSRRN